MKKKILELNIRELHNAFSDIKKYDKDDQKLILEEIEFLKLDFSKGTWENRDYIFSLVADYKKRIDKLYEKLDSSFNIDYGSEDAVIETFEDVIEDLMAPYKLEK